MEMTVFETIRTMLATRDYIDKSIQSESLRRILEAGRVTASGRNRQPWHFIIVEGKEAIKALSVHTPTGPYLTKAPLVIVVASDATGQRDTSRAIQNMMLTAWGDGIGSNWVSIRPEAKPLLGVPEGIDLICALPFGYPLKPSYQGKKNRKSMGEVAHQGTFGKPFA